MGFIVPDTSEMLQLTLTPKLYNYLWESQFDTVHLLLSSTSNQTNTSSTWSFKGPPIQAQVEFCLTSVFK